MRWYPIQPRGKLTPRCECLDVDRNVVCARPAIGSQHGIWACWRHASHDVRGPRDPYATRGEPGWRGQCE